MQEKKTNTKAKKVLSIVLSVLTYVFFAICLFALVLSVTVKKDIDGTATIGNMQMRIVLTNSMEKCDQTDVSGYKIKDIPVKSMVFVQTVPEEEQQAEEWYANLKVGDVLTFRYVYVNQETITHRIKSITQKQGGGYVIVLEGDNKSANTDTMEQVIDTSLVDSPNYVVGKVTGQSHFLGLLITAVKSPVGIVCIVIVPCVIIAVFEIIRLVNALTAKRRAQMEEANRKRDEELAEVKRQLAILQQAQANQSVEEKAQTPQNTD